ncbi:MAG: flagellar basal body rod protein FlgC [Proteobacteria bacterium]|nr:flagellar basal body rod protein FlgC [Pseudomonadota bacterium]
MTFFLATLFFAFTHCAWGGSLADTQKIASDNLRVNEALSRVAAENLANADSANYAPKSITVESKKLPSGASSVKVKRIKKDDNRVVSTYDPSHPQADTQGYVAKPDVDPMIELMNMQRTKHSSEIALKVFETATDMRHKMISMMGTR